MLLSSYLKKATAEASHNYTVALQKLEKNILVSDKTFSAFISF